MDGLTMSKEQIDVSDDNILLSAILDDHNITVKQLALSTGRAASTVYRYLAGEATIPSVIWRSLFDVTLDHRITKLITGDQPCLVVDFDIDQADIAALKIEVRQAQLRFEECLLSKTAGSKHISQVDQAFAECIKKQASLYQSFTGHFKII